MADDNEQEKPDNGQQGKGKVDFDSLLKQIEGEQKGEYNKRAKAAISAHMKKGAEIEKSQQIWLAELAELRTKYEKGLL